MLSKEPRKVHFKRLSCCQLLFSYYNSVNIFSEKEIEACSLGAMTRNTQHNDTQYNNTALFCWVSLMLTVTNAECHIKAPYAECRYAEYRYADLAEHRSQT